MATNYITPPPKARPTGRTDAEIRAAVAATSNTRRANHNEYDTYRALQEASGNKVAGYSHAKSANGAYDLTPDGTSTNPTVLTDTNIRDKTIPQLDQNATTVIGKYDTTKSQLQQQSQAQLDRQAEQDSKKDPIADAFSEQDNFVPDPYTQQQLDLIDRMSKSTDASTRLTAERQQQQYDQQRALAIKAGGVETGAAQTGLARLGGRYTPGLGGQMISQIQRGTNEKLASIDDEETNAMEQLRAAQDSKDYQAVGQKLDLLKQVRDDRLKALEDAQKEKATTDAANKKDVNSVLSDAAKNGAPADVLTAIAGSNDAAGATIAAGEYLQTGEYAAYAREVKGAGGTPVDPGTYYSKKIYGENGAPGSGALDGNIPFAATIQGAASLAGSVTGEKTANEQLASLAQSGDYPALLQRMETLARKGMGAANGAETFTAQNQIKALDNMQNVLQQYQAAGGDMGFLKGNEQQIATKIGQLATDPKFASIATQLTAAFQNYRQQMSGAAFGAKESAEYQSVFPSADKSFELNSAVMSGLKDYLSQNVNNAYETQLGEGYTNLKDYVDKGLTPTGKYLLKTEQDAQQKVIQLGKQDSAVQQSTAGFMADHPDASAYDVLQFLGVPVATSNEVAMTDPSKGIVGGYNIASYATDPNHEQRVATIYDKTKNLSNPQDVERYIQNIAPNSPIKGEEVIAAANITGVSPGMILAIMQQDSTLGTAGKAVRTKNPGNVGNTDSGATQSFPDWQSGILAVANNLAKRKVA